MRLGLSPLLLPGLRQLRLTLYLLSVASVLGVSSGYALYANAKDAALSFGAELAGLGDLTGNAPVLTINGERFHHATVVAAGDAPALLDRIQAACDERPGALTRGLAELLELGQRQHQHTDTDTGVSSLLGRGGLRHENEGRGMLVCFVDDGAPQRGGLAERVASFSRSGNVSAFGRARYAYVEAVASGQSRVSILWADTDLSLSRMFPVTGDAPGSDSALIPRPPESVRLLSAAADGMPFLLAQYASRQPPAALSAFYRAELGALGFERVGTEAQGAAYLRRDGHQALLSLLEQSGTTHVTLLEQSGALSSVDVTE